MDKLAKAVKKIFKKKGKDEKKSVSPENKDHDDNTNKRESQQEVSQEEIENIRIPSGFTYKEYKVLEGSGWSWMVGENMHGPVDWEEFKGLFKKGKISLNTRILSDEMNDFERLNTKNKILTALKFKG